MPEFGSNHWGVTMSPDGRWLATGECLGTITIWDWMSRGVVTNFICPFEFVCVMRFTRSGHYFNVANFNNRMVPRIRLWRTGNWGEVPLPENQFARAWAVDVSADDRWLAGGYADGRVRLFRQPWKEPAALFTNHTARVHGIQFSPDGRWLAATSQDGSARLWDVPGQRELTEAPLRGHPGPMFAVAVSPDGQRLATGAREPTEAVKLWDPVTQRELLTLRGGDDSSCIWTFLLTGTRWPPPECVGLPTSGTHPRGRKSRLQSEASRLNSLPLCNPFLLSPLEQGDGRVLHLRERSRPKE